MFHKVASIEPGSNGALYALFLDGTRKEYDIRRLFDRYPAFRQLAEDEALFRQVKVDQGGYGVSWNDELDLSCDELYDHGMSAEACRGLLETMRLVRVPGMKEKLVEGMETPLEECDDFA